MSTKLSKDHEKLLNHLTNNANKNDRLDVKLLETIDTMKVDFQHDTEIGNVIQCIADDCLRFEIVLNVHNIALFFINRLDFE